MEVLRLADIPFDALKYIVIESCKKQEEEPSSSSSSSRSDVSYSNSEDSHCESDILLEEDDITKVDDYVRVCQTIMSPSHAIELVTRVIQELIVSTKDHCLPWICSSVARSQRWFDYCLEQTHAHTDDYVCATALETACRYDNTFVWKRILDRKLLLIKASKTGRVDIIEYVFRQAIYDEKDAYVAFEIGMRFDQIDSAHAILRQYPAGTIQPWMSHKVYGYCCVSRNPLCAKRFFLKHFTFLTHYSDTEKGIHGDGYTCRLYLPIPLLREYCYRGRFYDVNDKY